MNELDHEKQQDVGRASAPRWPTSSSPISNGRIAAVVLVLVLAASLTGCGLTVTNEPPSYEELGEEEKNAVAVILRELAAFDRQVMARTDYSITNVVDKEKINVALRERIFVGNLGDGRIHVSIWENLSEAQGELVAQWFKTSPAEAKSRYEKFFYQFLAVVQGVKQYMFNVLTPAWVYSHRTLFNIERDSIRVALSHYRAEKRKTEMWNFVSAVCSPVLSQYGATYSAKFDKTYLQENYAQLADGRAPTGYLYFICRWIEMGKRDALGNLTLELEWLRDLPKP